MFVEEDAIVYVTSVLTFFGTVLLHGRGPRICACWLKKNVTILPHAASTYVLLCLILSVSKCVSVRSHELWRLKNVEFLQQMG